MTTYVLVHGALHGSWCWDRVAGPLRDAGHAADADHSPFLSVPDDFVARLLEIETKET
jgi:hypothetical protein